MSKSKLALASLVALALSSGCILSQQQLDDAKAHASQLVVGKDGGLVCTPDQMAHVSIPAGALAMDTTITIDPAAPPAAASGYTIVGQGYDFGPNGTHFSSKATVELHYDETKLPAGVTPQAISILAISDNGAKVEVLPDAMVDTSQHAVYASTSHFTWFAAIVGPNVQVGGPGGTPNYGTATASFPLRSNVWLGPDGWVRSDSNVYASTAPTSLSIRVDTAGALRNTTLRVEETLEDPGGPGTPWDRMPSIFLPLGSTATDGSGVLVVTLDGRTLQNTVSSWVRSAPGYPSGRVHVRVYTPAPIDVYVSLAMHPSVR